MIQLSNRVKNPLAAQGSVSKTCWSRLCFFLGLTLLLLLPQAAGAADSTPKSLFLPVKINAASPEAAAELAVKTDAILGKSFSGTDIIMPARADIAAEIDYQSTWPPSGKVLKSTGQRGGYRYLITGSLTMLGTGMSIDLTALDLKDESQQYFFKEIATPESLETALAALAGEVALYTNSLNLIARIIIKGNKRIDSGAIMRQIDSAAGQPYDPEKLRDDLKKVFKMGYFNDVELDVKKTARGKEVTFVIKEKAVISKISYTGQDEIKEEDIREAVKLKANSIYSEQETLAAIDNIRQLYKEKGYYNTKVESKLTETKTDRVELTFEIKEGLKTFIREIIINGNHTFSARKIKKVMSTEEKGWFSWFTDSGLLKRDMLEHDASRITAFYHNNGFVEAKVGEPEVSQEEEWLYITFNIQEGERYKVGKIDVAGDLIDDHDKLMKFLKVGEEEFFSRQVMREDIMRLTDFYSEKGFAFSEFDPDISKNAAERTVDVTYRITKGALVHINRIEIKGNTRTRDKVIRREMDVKENGIFDATAIKKSHQRLQRIEYFENLSITPQPTADEDLLDVIVEVKEKPTGTFSVGAGYSSVDHLSFMGEISENNFLGRGQRLSAKANIGSTNNQYDLSFTEPRLFDTKLLFGINFYNWEREYDDYTKDSTGFGLRLGYPLWDEWRTTVGYGWDDTNITEVLNPDFASPSIKESMDYHVTSSIKVNLGRDTRDRLYNPSTGSTHSISVKYAGGPLGGDNDFTKVEGTTGVYLPLFWQLVFHPELNAGYIFENGDSDHLPIYEKFYLGGLNSIRGFDSGSISPTEVANDINGNPVEYRTGGDKMWYANIELLFPLIKDAGLRGVIFYDIGNVYDVNESWNFTDKKHSAGGGFRWMSPIGPLRLEWGLNLDPVDNEDKSSWDFSIGGSF